MKHALQLAIICWVTFNFYGDPELHEPLGQIVVFSILVSYGVTWLLGRILYLFVSLLAIGHTNSNPER